MKPRKLRVGISRFCYAGNGGYASEHPDVGTWLMRVMEEKRGDERIEAVVVPKPWVDTPITLTRNAACQWAIDHGIDVLVMVDSDQAPDLYFGIDAKAQSFFKSGFDKIYQHYEKGPLAIVGPYCGPPPHPLWGGEECVYVFRWDCRSNGDTAVAPRLEMFSRPEASVMSGFTEVAAGPTGMCMIDVRCLTQVLEPPYFDYEWEGDGPKCPHCAQPKPGRRLAKGSTEDVFFFRNLSLQGMEKLGYNPVLCNWDAWAGHWKPQCVGKPRPISVSDIHAHLRDAVRQNVERGIERRQFKADDLPCLGEPMLAYEQVLKNGSEPARTAGEAARNRVQELIDGALEANNGCEQPVAQA